MSSLTRWYGHHRLNGEQVVRRFVWSHLAPLNGVKQQKSLMKTTVDVLSNISMWIPRPEKKTTLREHVESFLWWKCTKCPEFLAFDTVMYMCCNSSIDSWNSISICSDLIKDPRMSVLFMIINNYHLGDVMNNQWMFLWSRETSFFCFFFHFAPTFGVLSLPRKAFKWYSLLLDGGSLTKELDLSCI